MLGQQNHSQHLHSQLFQHSSSLLACNEIFLEFYETVMCGKDLKQLLPPAFLQVPIIVKHYVT